MTDKQYKGILEAVERFGGLDPEAIDTAEQKQYAHSLVRQQVWSSAFNHVASSATCPKSDVAIRWADIALSAFDERFTPKP